MHFIKPFAPLITWILLLLVLPPLGAWFGGYPLTDIFHFPLAQRSWDSLPLHSGAYWSLLALTGCIAFFALWMAFSGKRNQIRPVVDSQGVFPTWGWLGLAAIPIAIPMGLSGRPLAGLIVLLAGVLALLNADLLRRTNHSLMQQRPIYFLILFPAGLLLGWLIHYLNLFLQSWQYPGFASLNTSWAVIGLSLQYALLLPLLLSLRQWLASHPALLRRTVYGKPLDIVGNAEQGWLLLGLGAMVLAGSANWPERIYPLTWLAPLSIGIGASQIAGKSTLFSGIAHGDWSRVILTSLSALILACLTLIWNYFCGPLETYTLSLLQVLPSTAPPLPAFGQYAVFGLTGLWLSDQLIPHWKKTQQKRFPDFPVKIIIK